ncbi:MAG: hypothetical protein M1832_001938 [Thelocarpon impressellum]|nr:MAG: hypothetical protein M1832_001938 [Thelocarpon impressellum]
MKRLRVSRWSGQEASLRTRTRTRTRPRCLYQQTALRRQSTTTTPPPPTHDFPPSIRPLQPPDVNLSSAKLSALHARLALPPQLPLSTLALGLRDRSAYTSPNNNASLAQLGNKVMAYHLTEHLIAHYPRLPMAVLFAAMHAYMGPPALAALVREWGVEAAAEPGPEVDSGLLQFTRLPPGASLSDDSRPVGQWRRGISSRIVHDDEFGDVPSSRLSHGTTLERASASLAQAVVGAVHAHASPRAASSFFSAHVLSRHLSLSSLFSLRQPTRDLSRLCAREGLAGPLARLISETGRHSRHPLFVVGVYSGDEKLGEGAGSSLDEARNRAAAASLKAWYLYSPLEVEVPSQADASGRGKPWRPLMVDGGEVIV